MSAAPVRYTSADEDSARWDGFGFRPGDIVISTRSKSGTTWLQMICALLIFGVPDPPEPLTTLSPWLDLMVTPRSEIVARLEAQQHRRFIKTHTPLDGVPIDDRATYLVAARHPLDMAVSLYHQGDNINRARFRELTGQPEPSEPDSTREPLHEWLLGWINSDASPRDEMDSLPGVMWHLADAWNRRDQPNIVLVHYDDLLRDLAGQMRRLARRLDIDVPEPLWPTLVDAATFSSMRSHSDRLTPNNSGILKDNAAFFRRGTSGSGLEVLTDDELAHYFDRVSRMAPAPMLDWLHR
jgi:aryl sulfotransferase